MDTTVILKITTGHNSVKKIGGVMVLVLCISSDNALYLFCENIFNGFEVTEQI